MTALDRQHATLTARRLADLPALVDEAWQTWGTQAAATDKTPTRATPGSRCLADLDRLMLLTDVGGDEGLAVLHGWVRVITEETSIDPPAHDTIDDVCHWIATHADTWATFEWADSLHDDIRRLHAALRNLCRYRPEYRPRCRTCDNHVHLVDHAGQPATPDTFAYGRCAGCGRTYPKGPALDALGQTQEATIRDAARILQIPERTIRRWSAEGLIAPIDNDQRSRDRTYSLGAIRSTARRMGRTA